MRLSGLPSGLVLLRLSIFLAYSVYSALSYANVTLSEGDLSVVVYLPNGILLDEEPFYYASRFDHGSMIGSIVRKVRTINRHGEEVETTHTLFGTDEWRIPHNTNWPESGVGLAAEFGVGDDGAFCYYRCGWQEASDVTNGVLGYMEARNGEPFLKIGVGELIKGTCPTCDSTDDYRFNSPYLFGRQPEWKIARMSDQVITLEHEARLKSYGYKLVKEITLMSDTLTITTTLTNLGAQPFSTAWYSHNFFTCDGEAVGPGYELDVNIRKTDGRPYYEEPGTWSWSTPLKDYAKIYSKPNSVHVSMVRALDPGVRIKSEFVNDGSTNGGFTIQACDTELRSSIPEVETTPEISMYAYNLYIERGTFSPEPQILIHLAPGEARTWTQRLVIGPIQDPPAPKSWVAFSFDSWGYSLQHAFAKSTSDHRLASFVMLVAASCGVVFLLRRSTRRRRLLRHYNTIPDLDS